MELEEAPEKERQSAVFKYVTLKIWKSLANGQRK
jgi:hypothetical protein